MKEAPRPIRFNGWRVCALQPPVKRRHFRNVRFRRGYCCKRLAYYRKIAIHPTPAATLAEFSDRAAVGPIQGWIVLMIGFAYNFGWLAFALGTMWLDQREHGAKGDAVAMG
jgi:hypothetical protein